MKKIIFAITTLMLSCIGCKKEHNPPINFPVDLPNCKLLVSSQQGDFGSYTYEYNASGRLTKQIEKWNGVDRLRYILNYDGDRLVSRELWTEYPNETPKMASFDSLIYNNAGQISERRVLSPSDNFSIHLVYSYEYNSDGLPEKKQDILPLQQ
ncbi:MAG: hypothetical protein K9J37_03440 [Saprospiraceae bacterium]|nr:hypothetical protein [Saprospiraceae bacterium]MCF8248936.1 hypothetical protein [Saprospiraceae bacterium]MCF8279147.1 hypothetical protein [Bacteroidales bacterium]MCF8310830.1 hypothetical protein [Saprospiraceae bacterium]MCF8439582.1 hypothetical protein [Saprospiraceae bacterium]